MDIITKTTSIKEAEEILTFHDISHPFGWEIAIGMLLSDCDYLEVHDFGSKAYFNKIRKED